MRVIISGGRKAVRERVKQMVTGGGEIAVIGFAGCDSMLAETRRLIPDAVIMLADGKESSRDVMEATHLIVEARLATRVLIMTDNIVRDLTSAIKAGAAGLLSLSVDRNELMTALMVPDYQRNIRANS